jgi:hypothetical protein
MANWETVEEAIDGSGIYRLAYHFSVQRPTADMVAIGSTAWPKPAQYCALQDGAFVALPDDALTVYEAQQAAAEFAQLAAMALPAAQKLRGLLAMYGLTIPTTEAQATQAIMAMDLDETQTLAAGSLAACWGVLKLYGAEDCISEVLAMEAAQ